MRPFRFLFALAVLIPPSIASAQTTCAATLPGAPPESGANRPTCNVTRNATTTIASILRLGLVSGAAINLQATDTIAYEKTRTAVGGAGTTGTVVATPAALQAASARDSLIVQANRPYILTIAATTDNFKFDKDVAYNVCRTTNSSTTGCTTVEPLGAKPVGDLYWTGGDQTGILQITGLTANTPATVRTGSTGERYATGIAYSSAWFYATDIPGVYTATVRYTVTGQ